MIEGIHYGAIIASEEVHFAAYTTVLLACIADAT